MEALTALAGPAGAGTYTAYAQGAHLARWRPAAQSADVVWESAQARHEAGTPIRGGVPLCLPWFGPGVEGPFEPSHGFARIAPWRLRERHEGSTGTVLEWELTDADVVGLAGSQHFPHRFRASCVHGLGEQAEVRLTLANAGQEAFRFEVALHSYLHVGDVRRVEVTGLEGTSYWDKLTEQEQVQGPRLVLTGQTDRVYRSPGSVQVHDPVLERTLIVSSTGAANTVVWNPWTAQAAALSDLGDDEWRQFLCIEAGNVLDEALDLSPGASHTLTTRIGVG